MTTLTQRRIQMDNKLLNCTPCTCGGAIRLTREKPCLSSQKCNPVYPGTQYVFPLAQMVNVSQLRPPGAVRDTVRTQSWIYVKHYFDSSISPIIINQPINRRQ